MRALCILDAVFGMLKDYIESDFETLEYNCIQDTDPVRPSDILS